MKNKNPLLTSEPEWDSSTEYTSTSDSGYAVYSKSLWYKHNSTSKKYKPWLLAYLKHAKYKKADITNFKKAKIANNSLGLEKSAIYARMLMRGAPKVPDQVRKLKSFIMCAIDDGKNRAVEKITINKPKVDIQQRIKDKLVEYIIPLEDKVDEFLSGIKKIKQPTKWYNVQSYLSGNKIPASQALGISAWFTEIYKEELSELVGGKDKQLNEAYDYLTKPEQKRFFKFIDFIVTECNEYAHELKQTRKPRRKRMKSKEQIVKKVSYLKESKEYDLKSIKPEKILAATKLLVFNTKSAVLTLYIAKDPAGFGIKGTTIENFSEEKTISRKVRKAVKTIKSIHKKVKWLKVMDDIKTKDKKITGRLNKHTIIMKVK